MKPVSNAELDVQLAQGLRALGFPDDAGKRHICLQFIALLCAWNKAYNLTATHDPREIVARHVLDSLSIAKHLCGSRFIDIGSGAGFPGIPLAIWFPEHEFHLLDSNGKKIRFLFQAKTSLLLPNVQLHQQRAEAFVDQQGFDCVLSRAFASLHDMLSVTQHLCAPGGCFLAMKALPDEYEMSAVSAAYTVAGCWELQVPGVAAPRQLLKITRRA